MHAQRSQGFTLVELLIAISIVAILLAWAWPSFQDSLRSNRVATSANELIATMSLARSEALRSPQGGRVCTSEDGLRCGGDWSKGWIVWTDRNADGAPAGDEVMRYVPAPAQVDLSASANAGSATQFRFDARGRVADGNAREFVLQPQQCQSGAEQVRRIVLAATGQLRLRRAACP
ncbi:GspH/FimT family pseudopilin [Lysobacter silvisoli]|uniref:Type II secretion system protein H n=1 Tax=Lysobacter silvisoli TaxID=2293254 RepID=A0A371K5N8_9GAMM|nr:GspH/FimT family pseudopilin [Lysobacter silvisoli]RDZ29253.1 prepilin-type N-terminal cleavage/methylation domain-containing protein [Lysobacter silvisoli]